MMFPSFACVTKSAGLLFGLLISNLMAVTLAAQEDGTVDALPVDDISITAQYAVSLAGVQTNYDVHLVNREVGLAYDVFSLTRQPEIQQAAFLNKDQLDQIEVIREQVRGKVMNQAAQIALNPELKVGLKQVLLDAEQETMELLSDAQREQFQQAVARHAIRQVGWQKYLQWKHPEVKLSDQAWQQLEQSQAEAGAKLKKRIETLQIEANQALLKALPTEAQTRFDEMLNAEAKQQWMRSELFIKKQDKPVNFEAVQRTLKKRTTANWARTIAYSKSLQKRLKLTRDQVQTIDDHRKSVSQSSDRQQALADSNRNVKQMLTSSQQAEFMSGIVPRQVTKSGTVSELAVGTTAQHLDLTAEESSQLFTDGKRIFEELLLKIQQAKDEANAQWADSLTSLEGSNQQSLLGLVGDRWIE